jgi:hypothetical protein
VQQLVGAHVLDFGHRRLEPDRQEDAREQKDDERVEGDLAEQERPVVREDLAEVALAELRKADALVEPARRAAQSGKRLLAQRGRGPEGR